MRGYRFLICIGVSAVGAATVIAQTTASKPLAKWTFEKNEFGTSPPGWRVAETKGSGKTGTWTVAVDETAPSKPNVLKLEARASGSTFNLLIAEKTSYKDLVLQTQIKAISGNEDQGGGLIWRAQDENNYYVCRINPLEGNFRVYKVEGGKRSQLQSANLETESGRWYEVRAGMVGNRMECFVDGKKYLETTDDTFKQAGMVGLWTKADASSAFDSIAIEAGKLSPQHRESAADEGHDNDHDNDHDDD